MNGNPTETEIKLLFPPGAAARIERHPVFEGAEPETRHERTTYFDTDAFALREHGYSLRVRKSGRAHIQTLKHASARSAVVGQRDEWEWPVVSNRLDTGPLDALAGKADELEGAYAQARPKFVTDIRRKAYELVLDGGTKIELAIDRGVIHAGTSREAVNEIEVEIKDGPPGPAYRLALDLARRNGLRLGPESKADRGYRLVEGKRASPAKARAAEIAPGASLKEALAFATGAALSQFVANMPAAEAGEAEGIHQMRVALRRLRTAFVLFGPCLQTKAIKRFNAAIRKMGVPLGAARDWDVFVIETMPEAVKGGVPEPALAGIAAAARKARERSHAAVRRMLAGPEPTTLVLEIEAWVSGGRWRGDDCIEAATPVVDLLPKLLGRIRRKVGKRARGLTRRSSARLHPLRKSIKKLRHASEDSAALFKRSRVSAYARHCRRLQILLGEINDAAVTKRLLAAIGSGAKRPAELLEWNAKRSAAALKMLPDAWARLDAAKAFWR